MTLILSVATEDYIVQVSDRRLTWLTGPNANQVADDNSNKAVYFNHRMVFGYTGIAEIGRQRTDKWLTKTLTQVGSKSLSNACQIIKNEATEAFKRIIIEPRQKDHAFVGIGWTRAKPEQPFQPIIVEISNAQDDTGKWLARARDEFSLNYRIWSESDIVILKATGQLINKNDSRALSRMLRKIAKKAPHPDSVARVLVDRIREMASRNDRIGRNLLVVSLPKASIPTGPGYHAIPFKPPSKSQATFLYIPEGQTDGIMYGPNVVVGGASAVNIEAGPLPK